MKTNTMFRKFIWFYARDSVAMERWHSFLRSNKGRKLSMQQLSALYRTEKAGSKQINKSRKVQAQRGCTVNYNSQASYTINSGPDHTQFNLSRTKNWIYYSGDLYTDSCDALCSALRDAFDYCQSASAKNEQHVNLRLQSGGGSVLATLAVIDAITQQPVPVHCHVAGYAMSAAAILSTACAKRFMSKQSVMMLHEASTGLTGGFTHSDVGRVLHDVGVLETFKNNILRKRSKLTLKKIKAIEKKAQYLTPEECLKYGLVDKVV